MKAVKVSKSPGPDGIHPKVLRETEEELLKPLTTVFKQSLREGKLPKDWKLGNITALFKAGSKSKCENYRPISLTSIPGK